MRTALDAYLLFLGALAALALVQSATRERPAASAFERARARPAQPPQRPEELERLERQLLLGLASAADGERLRLALREAVAGRLEDRLGLDLAGDAARAQLGERVHDLVRDERIRIREPFGPGLAEALVREAIEAAERV